MTFSHRSAPDDGIKIERDRSRGQSHNGLSARLTKWSTPVRGTQLAPYLLATCLAAGYLYLLFWFASTNFYAEHFFDHGAPIRHYAKARLAFIPYMAWLVYAVGAGSIALGCGQAALKVLPAWERYPLGFVAGAGVWHALLFPIGLAGLDIKPVAVGLTLCVMAASVPHLGACVAEALRRTPTLLNIAPIISVGCERSGASKSVSQRDHRFLLQLSVDLRLVPVAALGMAMIAVASLFILVKGLYPAGGHDYYLHYFPFYMQVIQSGSILPNDVWYQFYYSKGAGLYFLAMLLSDPLAPQLVTTGFVGAAALMVFAFLKRAAPGTVLPWVGMLLYGMMFIYTPGPIQNMREGGWGDLEKIHELSAVLMLGIVWITFRLFGDAGCDKGPWILALHLAIVAVGLLLLPELLLVGAYLTGYGLWFVVRRRQSRALLAFAAAVTAGLTLLGVAAVNYCYTGFPSDQGLPVLWRYADLQKILEWGVIFELLLTHMGLASWASVAAPRSWDLVFLIAGYLRLELWWPLAAPALVLIAFRFPRARARLTMGRVIQPAALAALVWFAVVVVFGALFGGGRMQTISFYRMSSFSYAPMLCLVLLLWVPALATGVQTSSRWLTFAAVGVLGFAGLAAADIVTKVTLTAMRDLVASVIKNADNFWLGRFSLKDAYQNQQGWPGREPWGGIYPGIEMPWRIVGPHQRIWSFHVHSYCMLPGCNVQTVQAFRFSPHWATVYFDTPERAAAVLRSEGLNYFFFSTELGEVPDLLESSPLFAPDQVSKYLGVRWTDGRNYLLSWVGPDTTPLDPDVLIRHKFYAAAPGPAEQEMWRKLGAGLAREGMNLRPFLLPWCTTCDGLKPIE